MFDGSIERISCITRHDDYSAMTNQSVLTQVAPLLRDRNGRGYRRRDGQTQNQLSIKVAFEILSYQVMKILAIIDGNVPNLYVRKTHVGC